MKQQFNIPNLLSALRLLTVPSIFLLIINSTRRNYPYLIVVYALSFVLDFFDGYIARKLNQETDLGKILDPVADKLMIFSSVIGLSIRSDFPFWLAVVVVGRDLVILAAGSVILRGKKFIPSSMLIGKITFAMLGSLLMIYIIDLHETMNLLVLKRWLIPIVLTFLIWSLSDYYDVYKDLTKRVKHA